MAISDIIFRADNTEWQIRGGDLSEAEREGLYQAALHSISINGMKVLARKIPGLTPKERHTSFVYDGQKYRSCLAETIDGNFFFLRRINGAVPELQRIGLPYELLKSLERKERRGLVIIGGSMGSGKTTTAAALCRYMALQGCNCVTLEDPPEYNLQGRWGAGYCYQMRVTPETLTEGIATVKRQGAPEVIYIGEIRDSSAARQSIMEANIGHYVLTTLHASSVENVLWRYISLSGGLENTALYLVLAEALSLVVHQHLHRSPNGRLELETTWIDFDGHANEHMLRGAIRERQPVMCRDNVQRKICVSHLND